MDRREFLKKFSGVTVAVATIGVPATVVGVTPEPVLNAKLFAECFYGHGGHIFSEYYERAILSLEGCQTPLDDIVEFIKFGLMDLDQPECLKWRIEEANDYKLTEELDIIRNGKDPVSIVRAYNKFYESNGESHGTIFAMLINGGHILLINELLKELSRNSVEKHKIIAIGWDT